MVYSALLTYLLPLGLIILFLGSAIRILPEYQRGVVFFLGRFQAVKGPGLILIVPGIQQVVRIDLRVITMDVPEQDLITKDNVTVRVNAVLYFKVVESDKAVIQVEDYQMATSQLAQTTLRSVLGQHDLDELLSERERLNRDIQTILDDQTDAWGIKVVNVEIKHVDLNENMIRAIARQAEAERNRRAKVINAEGELQAAERLRGAAEVISTQPQALQLRYLQTLADMSSDRATTVVFPLPMEWLSALTGAPGMQSASKQDADPETSKRSS
ncbi:MAG: slipin family protein [Lamprobacter sp.]|uniref:slipin family protein n=1 Tax=Lamprobacter sp. TaxID=3100796 RepID=UPI002B25B566|nr:slipin family protein [Lamprobacter sp.]MEA3641909.1 slipin family protein [Lamprobacter sp.]